MTREQFISQVKIQQNGLRSFLLALCAGNMADADDIAQDTLMQAFLAIDRYIDSGQFKSWLFKIAYNRFLNHKAAKKPCSSLEEVSGTMASESADNCFTHQQLYMALSTLPPKERSAIILYYLSGYSVKDIATIMESSEDAVKKQMSRGREKLKTIITL